MRCKVLNEREPRTYAVVMDKGEEAVAALGRFAEEERVTASHLTAVGAFRDAVLGFFDPERKAYRRIVVGEQVEVVSLVGNIAVEGDERRLHAHVVVARADGTALGGHLLEAHVWPTLEVVVEEEPAYLRRRTDPETGLALLAV